VELILLAKDVSPLTAPSFVHVSNIKQIQQYPEYIPKFVFPWLGIRVH
jgi:hypothetical protein